MDKRLLTATPKERKRLIFADNSYNVYVDGVGVGVSSHGNWRVRFRYLICCWFESFALQNLHAFSKYKQFSPAENGSSTLQVSLLESNMVISDGKIIHESFSLFNANKWLKAVVKGDSMLFMYKMNNDCRRFRIKFNKSSDRTAMENCRHFISKISPHIPVREMPVAAAAGSDSQLQMEDSQLVSPESQQVSRGATGTISCSSTASATASGLTLPDLAHKALTSSEPRRDGLQSSGHIDVPQDQLSLMIRLCLTDSNFPAFVESVEKELTNLTSSD